MKNLTCSLLLFPLCIDLAAQSMVPQAPTLDLSSYILLEASTNTVLAEFNSDNQIAPASMTKVMSGYVIADQIASGAISLDDQVLISEKAWKTGGSKMFIEAGKRISVKDLLSGIIIQSGNDATIAMAEYVAGSEEGFVDFMNAYAAELGLSNSLFQNSTGLSDPNHFTSAKDLANLTKALINKFPDHYATYREKEFTFGGIRQLNRNKLLWRDDSVDGVKTGHTDSAGFCLVSSAKRNDMRLIAVVAGSPSENDRLTASQRLLEYGFRFFATQKLVTKNTKVTSAKVWGGQTSEVSLGSQEDLYLTLPRSEFNNIKANYKFKNNIQAPIEIGQIIGSIEFTSNDRVVLSAPLVAIESVEAKGFFGRLIAKLIYWITSLFSFS
ncbi:MAG: D-alanyl-D-alanine carboxypeptidase [SAR86 cluster bacterium BACL1 MAG-120920-bin57]|jgi:serine-type D-Ala-D-Ala carboxypeptidase (penicillin-binding protein 5/6)|uniref:serine-type D-Ala-D-Ala carboxypeptidase n=2 Tax=SAR86 cluster TaxID=62672 RepID=A0A0R2UFQ2_9GAMM|nr:MAG: D-alanyl-D-alanine carboxypeptidase [SAR86 cluster bacterium BACL1 MAG-120507-bin14]KRO38665.1 MAG: D-alanyl-D-alanine carboxypeptidase [SAR86 cluster bacterium BACL1 MAG-120920-bin57]KRO96064.1 MAG: D-alanyl-D-alanine carboxypeptidase [SAR86 cluster bacterium BACL1 MAG-120820-bin45]KRO99255.1 MAG: D-alanyl-D-alanine carboxypeptidase [SAR86 cluster bacterium BACL1 MAG-120823-bin87]KRP00406.1 MAG: D-alanyl-D-alanine carboxypeptidase [SAR86 cluster bacterium BACL1 MAG-120813-bin36]KRP013